MELRICWKCGTRFSIPYQVTEKSCSKCRDNKSTMEKLILFINNLFTHHRPSKFKTITATVDIESMEADFEKNLLSMKEKITESYYYAKKIQNNYVKNNFFNTICLGMEIYDELKHKEKNPNIINEYLKQYLETLRELSEEYVKLSDKKELRIPEINNSIKKIEEAVPSILKGLKNELKKIMSQRIINTETSAELMKKLSNDD